MAWVPLFSSGIAYDLQVGPGVAEDGDNVVASITSGTSSGFILSLPGATEAHNLRFTFTGYQAGDAGGNAGEVYNAAEINVDNGAAVYVNEAAPFPAANWPDANPVIAFEPSPLVVPFAVGVSAQYFQTTTSGDGVPVAESWSLLIEVEVAGPAGDTLNCDCDDGTANHPTLLELRKRLIVRLGYAAQAANPPPGMRELCNDFLYSAQVQLEQRLNELGIVRFFTWDLQEGVKLYDLDANEEECTVELDPLRLEWVGIEYDGIWRKLVSGIPPELYTHDVTAQWPFRYEIRQCIEIWPPPLETRGRLVIKGSFGVRRFTEDTDRVTLDPELVFLQALADAQAHYRKPNAQKTQQQAEVRLQKIVAGTHGTARYFPGTPDWSLVPGYWDYPIATPPFGTPGSPL